MRSLLAAAVMAGGLLVAPGAFAHAQLQHAIPPVGGTVAEAPGEVELTFSEGVEPMFCTLVVQDATGAREDSGALHLVAGNPRRLAVAVKPLVPGVYTVTWHATSVDTHRTEGTFHFTVGP